MENYKIYCHLFPNGKRYIGLTGTSLARRFRNGEGYNKCPYMKKAIEKYGWENIEHLLLEDNLTKEEAEEKEKYYIQLYDTRNQERGYNLAVGGNTATKYNYEELLEDWNLGLSIGEIAEKHNCAHQEIIGRILDGLGVSKNERMERGNQKKAKTMAKPIAQYDLNNNLLNTYESAKWVKRNFGYDDRSISKVCKGERKTAYGFIWRYIEKE